MKAVTYSRDAVKTLRRMPANVAATIRGKVLQYATDPSSLANNVKALRGESGIHRLRVGDWRIVFSENRVVIAIIRIAPRGSVYE